MAQRPGPTWLPAWGALWPPATPDLHVLDLEPGVRLLLAAGLRPWLRLLRLQADLVLFDPHHPPPSAERGAAADAAAVAEPATASADTPARCAPGPAATAQWDAHALKALGRLAAPRAVWPGQPGGQPPRGAVHTPPGAQEARRHRALPMAPAGRHAVVIGAGIAGACAAHALARAGWACTVLDAGAAPAQGASGNAAGLFHGTVHPGDGLHARFTRACALHAARLVQTMVEAGVPGHVGGLLRAHAHAHAGMHGGTPWPAGWAQQLDASGVQQRVPGLRADSAWFFPGGGWVAAADAVRWLLQAPGIRFQGGALVHTLQRCGEAWVLLDAAGHALTQADAVVLATAGRWPLLRGARAETPR